jgi:PAS domain S-box-containing protein
MSDKNKIKQQLLNELTELRQRITELEAFETNRKEGEEEFREVQDRFRGIYNASKDAIGYSTLKGVLLDVNDSFLRLTGYSREELSSGRRYQEITPEEYHEFEAQMIEKVLKTGEPVEYEKEYVRKDGLRVPILLTVFIVKGTDGKPVGLAAIIKDITERKQAEERFRLAVESAPTAIVMVNEDGNIILVNSQTEKLFGYSRQELIGQPVEILVPERFRNKHLQYRKAFFAEPHTRALGVGRDLYGLRKDGSEFPVEIGLNPIETKEGILVLSTIVDITKRRLLYEKSQKQAEELRVLYEDLSERNKDLEILNTITQAVHQSLGLEDVYKIALDMTMALENIDMAMIYLVDGDRKEAILHAHRNIPEDYIRRAGRIPYPKGITWKVIETGEIMNVEDAQKNPDIGPAGRDLGHHGILGIPIILEGKVMGVIWFFSYKERQFNKQEVDLLSSLGNQIAIAIAKAKLYRELSKKNRYEAIINAVTRGVHQSINLQTVLENAVEAMSKNIDAADTVAIYLVEREEAVLKAHRGLTDQYIDQARRISYPKFCTWKTIMEGKPMYCLDVDKDTVIGSAGSEMGTKSYLCMPISYEGNTIGVLNMNSFQKNAFDEEELKLLEIVAQQIKVAINNAKIAEALRQSEERYRTLFDQTPVGVYIFDKELKITECNERFVQMLQSSYDRIIGLLDIRKLEDQIFVPAMEKALEGQSSYHEGFYKATTSPAKLWLSLRFSPLREADGNVIGGMGVVEDITDRKLAEEQLRSSREQLRKLAAHLEIIREDERTKIAREVHDEMGQALTGLKMSLSWMGKKLSEAGDGVPRSLFLEEITSMSKLADSTIQRVREISTELRPGVLDDLGLTAAIEWQAQEFQTRAGIRCSFTSSPANITLDQDRSTAVFRILQETLTNVARHANATRVDIRLKENASNLILEVRDNGKGITEREISNSKSLGLLGMRERALFLGGEVNIRGTPGKGTSVRVQIPVNI